MSTQIIGKLIELSYHEGYSSYIKGVDITFCWYAEGTTDAINWVNGWKNAQADAEVKTLKKVTTKEELH